MEEKKYRVSRLRMSSYHSSETFLRRIPISFRVLMEHDSNTVELFQSISNENSLTNIKSIEEIYSPELQEYFILLHYFCINRKETNYPNAVVALSPIISLCLQVPYRKTKLIEYPCLSKAQSIVANYAKKGTAGVSNHLENIQGGGLAMALIEDETLLLDFEKIGIFSESKNYIDEIFEKTMNNLESELLKNIFKELKNLSKIDLAEFTKENIDSNQKKYEFFSAQSQSLQFLYDQLISASKHSYSRYLGNI
jgi:hypothetical protein